MGMMPARPYGHPTWRPGPAHRPSPRTARYLAERIASPDPKGEGRSTRVHPRRKAIHEPRRIRTRRRVGAFRSDLEVAETLESSMLWAYLDGLGRPGGAENSPRTVLGLHTEVALGAAHRDRGLEAVPGDGSGGFEPLGPRPG